MLREDIQGLLKATPRDLRKFGLMVGGVCCALGLLFYLRHKPWWPWLVWPGAPLVVLGAILPRCLKWIYVGWMTLAMLLGAIVSTVLLTLLFYLIVTPLGLVARLAGKDFLRQKLEPRATSYWIARDTASPKPKQAHERQF
jgi:Saxitoxin biosynthesis operon protein SxtJ